MTSTYARPAIWIACSLLALAGLAALVVAVVLLGQTVTDPSDEWNGLASFLAALSGGVGLVLVALATTVALLARRHVRGAGLTLCVLGGLSAALGAVSVGAVGTLVSAPLVVGSLLVGGLGFAAVLGVGRAVDSPRGYPG